MVLLPLTVSVMASPSPISARVTCHFSVLFAVVVLVFPPKVTETSSPTSAQPQIRMGALRCKTIWSLKMAGSFTSAQVVPIPKSNEMMMTVTILQMRMVQSPFVVEMTNKTVIDWQQSNVFLPR